MRILALFTCLFLWQVFAEPITTIHQEGYCAMRGQCGPLMQPYPCVNNTPAVEPETVEFRDALQETCGMSLSCCDIQQLNSLLEQAKQAEQIIASCPACWKNFLQFWCSFTCSPNQSTFINVTSYDSQNEAGVGSVDYWVGDQFGRQFYDSCKDIQFGASNGFAMDLIGGGAKNWHEMLSFMGMKRPMLGSPFQIDFPTLDKKGLDRYDDEGKSCSDPDYRCSCIDCQEVCPVLPPLESPEECNVGLIRCWSFAMLMTYLTILVLASLLVLARNKRIGLWTQRFIGVHLDQLETQGLLEDDIDDDEELLDPDYTPRRYWLNSRLQNWFYYQGLYCARYPGIVILSSLILVTLASLGWSRLSLERNPVNLWVSPSSTALEQKNYFDQNFGPFYRTAQVFFVADSPVASADRIESLFKLESEIRDLRSEHHQTSLRDLCFQPVGGVCIVQSITGYWKGDIYNFDPDYWNETLQDCASQPSSCLPEFMQPLKPEMVLGGYEKDDYVNAKALVLTYVLKNSVNDTEKAEDWEKSLLTVLSGLEEREEWKGVRISYSTESSLEAELNKSSNTDIQTVILSYLVMFIYASVALGRFSSFNKRFFVDSKFSLAVCGILIVLFSVSSAVGIFSMTGRKITLIIAEVIPFLVLAVGVDNIFILCHEYQRRIDLGEDESIEERTAKTLGKMGPSILLSSLSETIAFGLGMMVTMPAVSSFAMMASIAVFIDFVLQVTCFVSCLALDARRVKDNRMDCVPCVPIKTTEAIEKEGWLETMIQLYYTPFLLHEKVRYFLVIVFLGMFMFGLSLMPQVPIGLDQRIALPSDSYLVNYFNDLDRYFYVGPPVYFVVRDTNLTKTMENQKICGRSATCNQYSLANMLELERKRSDQSYIGQPTSVWVDDFMLWMDPIIGCCQKKQSRPDQLCGPRDRDCIPCVSEGFPEGQEFLNLYNKWIEIEPNEDCPVAGKGAYTDAIVSTSDSIEASHFRTFHTPLRSQEQFIEAYASARRISDELSEELGMDVFAYSIFYVFFEQYTYIVSMAFQILGLAVLSIFIVCSSLLGSLRSGILVMAVVIMILVDLVGVMTLWNISLNAVSLVNLVICIGISVEFCCHIARSFMVAGGNLNERAGKSLVDVGGSVFCGITLTKFAGIVVLAFTRSKIFEVYYFRMYLAIVVLGALHGLVLLPILLSLFGGEGMALTAEFDEDGFAWNTGQNSQDLLIDDTNDNNEVYITDVPRSQYSSVPDIDADR